LFQQFSLLKQVRSTWYKVSLTHHLKHTYSYFSIGWSCWCCIECITKSMYIPCVAFLSSIKLKETKWKMNIYIRLIHDKLIILKDVTWKQNMPSIYPLRRRIRYLSVRFEIQWDKFVTQPVKGRIRILLGLQNTVLGLGKPRPIWYFEDLI